MKTNEKTEAAKTSTKKSAIMFNRTKIKKIASNALAILMAFVMVFWQTPAYAYAEVARSSSVVAAMMQVDEGMPGETAPEEATSEPATDESADSATSDEAVNSEGSAADDQAASEDSSKSAAAASSESGEGADNSRSKSAASVEEPAADDRAASANKNSEESTKTAKDKEKRNDKKSFTYEDNDVKVTATLTNPDALPKDVRFKASPITEQSADYSYDAYMQALNDNAAEDVEYTADNTLLYDFAFLTTDKNGKTVEVQPEKGSVNVSIVFKKQQLTEGLGAEQAADIDVMHLPLREVAKADTTAKSTGARAGDVRVEKVSDANVTPQGNNAMKIRATDFSAYAFTYTVDFTHDGYTFSIEGESEIMLSALFEKLGIEENAAKATEVTFSNPELVAVGQVEGDWKLTSLKPFTSEETLTVKMASGAMYVIAVADALTSLDVSISSYDSTGENLVTFAPDNTNGSYWVYAYITAKGTGSNGEIKGWASARLDNFVNMASQKTVSFNQFSTGRNPNENPVNFNSDNYDVTVRMYWCSDPGVQVTRNFVEEQATATGSDRKLFETIDGYEFQGSEDPHPTKSRTAPAELNLKKGFDKEYVVRLTFDEGGSISDDGRYYVIGKIPHETSDSWFYFPIESASSQDVVINNGTTPGPQEWLTRDGHVKDEKFVGNERPTTFYIVEWVGDGDLNFNDQLTNKLSGNGGSAKVNVLSQTDALGDYTYTFGESRIEESSTDEHIDKFIDSINFELLDNTGVSRSAIESAVNPATDYGLYVINWTGHNTDMEANVAAAHSSKGLAGLSDYGYSNRNTDINILDIDKLYLKDGEPSANEQVTIRLYKKEPNGSYALKKQEVAITDNNGIASIHWNELEPGEYQIREYVNGKELTKSDNVVGEGADKITATFEKDTFVFVGSGSNINYFQDIDDDVSLDVLKQLIGKSRNGVLVIGNDYDYGRMVEANNALNPGERGTIVKAGEEIPGYGTAPLLNIENDFASLKQLSTQLANAHDSKTVNVYDVKWNESNDINYLRSDGKLIVFNIDMTGAPDGTPVNVKANIDGVNQTADFDADGQGDSSRIVFNLYQVVDGQKVPYTGSFDTAGESSGVLLAPSATVKSLDGNWGGTIIADTAVHGGSEIHSEYNGVDRKDKATLKNEKGEAQQTTDVEVGKAWLNADGSKTWPEGAEVSIQLTADGEAVNGKTATLSADQPSYKFESLPKYQADGETEIAYSVAELEVPGYGSEVGELDNGKITVTNTEISGSINLSGKKYLNAQPSAQPFEFKITEVADAQGTAIAPTGDEKVFSDTATNDKDGVFAFPEIAYTASDIGDHYYKIEEVPGNQAGVTYDEAIYIVKVTVSQNAGNPSKLVAKPDKYEMFYGQDGELVGLGSFEVPEFYNNSDTMMFGAMRFRSAAWNETDASVGQVSVFPEVKKEVANEEGSGALSVMVPGEFTFELHKGANATDADSLIAIASNDEQGRVAFFDKDKLATDDASETMWGLVFVSPGTYEYTIIEKKGDAYGVTYDSEQATMTVTVSEADDHTLTADVSYSKGGQTYKGGDVPTFTNMREGMDLQVYKRSRFGGEGLSNCTYALWMHSATGDVMLQEATSDATGLIKFENVALIPGQKYFYKEVEAPAGHTVDPYRTAYWTVEVDENGKMTTKIVEETAGDGWHSKYDNIENDKQGE